MKILAILLVAAKLVAMIPCNGPASFGYFDTSEVEIFNQDESALVTIEAAKIDQKIKANCPVMLKSEKAIAVSGEIYAPKILCNAKQIHILGSAIFDVSESGIIQLGFEETENIDVDREAHFYADAADVGDGGKITVRGHAVDCQGKLSAKGGFKGGNGGLVEFIAHGTLNDQFQVDVSAEKGKTGTLRIDPKMISIVDGGSDPATGNTFGSNSNGTVNISPDSLETALASANVILEANTDCVFASSVNSNSSNSLTVSVGRSVIFNPNVTLTTAGGDFIVTINDESAVADDRDSGLASVTVNSTAVINTNGGNVTATVGSFGGSQVGQVALSGSIDAGGGDVSLEGFGGTGSLISNVGIYLQNEASIETSGTGTISLTGTGAEVTSGRNYGIYMLPGAQRIESVDGNITLTGNGGSNGSYNIGVYLETATVVKSSGSGNVTLEGHAGPGNNFCVGIYCHATSMSVTDGILKFDGDSVGSGSKCQGINFDDCIVESEGSGAIDFIGTGSVNGISQNHGVCISGNIAEVKSDTGNITVTGTAHGTGSYNFGFVTMGTTIIESTGTGGSAATITITGTGSHAQSNNYGIYFSCTGDCIRTDDGAINMTGNAVGTGSYNEGFRIDSGTVRSTGSGAITIEGSGGGSNYFNNGVDIASVKANILSSDSDITLTGTSYPSGINGLGVVIYDGNNSGNVATTYGALTINSTPSL